MTSPLAIEGPSGSSSLIDALAYVDPMSAQDRQAAEALIDEEMQVMRRSGKRPEQYVSHLRPISSFLQFEVRYSWAPSSWSGVVSVVPEGIDVCGHASLRGVHVPLHALYLSVKLQGWTQPGRFV
jgi:hypothetical protein